MFGGKGTTELEDLERQVAQSGHDVGAGDLAGAFEVDVLVVTLGRLGRGREDRFRKLRGKLQPFRKVDATHRSGGLVVLPPTAGEIAADHAFDRHDLGGTTEHHAPLEGGSLLVVEPRHVGGVGREQVVLDDACFTDPIEPRKADLGQQTSLRGKWGRHHDIEGTHAIRGHDQYRIGPIAHGNAVDVPYLSFTSVREVEIRAIDGFEGVVHGYQSKRDPPGMCSRQAIHWV